MSVQSLPSRSPCIRPLSPFRTVSQRFGPEIIGKRGRRYRCARRTRRLSTRNGACRARSVHCSAIEDWRENDRDIRDVSGQGFDDPLEVEDGRPATA